MHHVFCSKSVRGRERRGGVVTEGCNSFIADSCSKSRAVEHDYKTSKVILTAHNIVRYAIVAADD